jgi:hypothetical protein
MYSTNRTPGVKVGPIIALGGRLAGQTNLSREQIVDIERQCERLSSDYSYYIDNGRLDLFADLFTDDGVLQLLGAPIPRDEFSRAFVIEPPYQLMHVCTNIRVTVTDADNALGSAYLAYYEPDVTQLEGMPADATMPAAMGIYHDQFRRTANGWRFARRELKARFCKTRLLG